MTSFSFLHLNSLSILRSTLQIWIIWEEYVRTQERKKHLPKGEMHSVRCEICTRFQWVTNEISRDRPKFRCVLPVYSLAPSCANSTSVDIIASCSSEDWIHLTHVCSRNWFWFPQRVDCHCPEGWHWCDCEWSFKSPDTVCSTLGDVGNCSDFNIFPGPWLPLARRKDTLVNPHSHRYETICV